MSSAAFADASWTKRRASASRRLRTRSLASLDAARDSALGKDWCTDWSNLRDEFAWVRLDRLTGLRSESSGERSESPPGEDGGEVASVDASALRAAATDAAASLRASTASFSAFFRAATAATSSALIFSSAAASSVCSSAAASAAARPLVSRAVSALRCARSMPVICASASFARRSASFSRFTSVSSEAEIDPGIVSFGALSESRVSSAATRARRDSFSRA
mmetsp:Transcript_9138/g.41529  ORF Transcript_9138/g.41529 Transcript_9138/m.41529 type:complete len:221 (+) Transcript_9138:3993-4655(+)